MGFPFSGFARQDCLGAGGLYYKIVGTHIWAGIRGAAGKIEFSQISRLVFRYPKLSTRLSLRLFDLSLAIILLVQPCAIMPARLSSTPPTRDPFPTHSTIVTVRKPTPTPKLPTHPSNCTIPRPPPLNQLPALKPTSPQQYASQTTRSPYSSS